VHQADVSAVLIATTECMLEGLKAGKQVNFGDLGAFRLQKSVSMSTPKRAPLYLIRALAVRGAVLTGDIHRCLATTECMLEGLKAGKQVNFGDLGAFRLQINSGGAPSADLFTSDYIKGVNIQFVPGEELQVIFQGLKFNLVPTRAAQAAVIKAQKAGKTTVDISGKNGSSDSESPDEI